MSVDTTQYAGGEQVAFMFFHQLEHLEQYFMILLVSPSAFSGLGAII